MGKEAGRKWADDDTPEAERWLQRALAVALFAAGALLGVLVAKAQAAPASLGMTMTMDDLAAGSDAIVVGRVQSTTCREGSYDGLGTILFTDVTIEVEQTCMIRGALPPQRLLTIAVPGGEIGDTVLVCSEAPRFEIGERVLVFVRDVRSEHRVWGLDAGKYTIERDVVQGRAGAPLGADAAIRDVARWLSMARRRSAR
ncbi:MAG: hypothetical protein HY292_14260 [Planctomycetes bacterium]|nr:hypothetical protein [Planctomycetota bacterium]